MAKAVISNFYRKPKRKRPGVYAKTKAAVNKGSKNYLKKYRGQGR